MIRFTSLRARISVLYSATIGAALLFIALAMQLAISRNAEQQVRAELAASSTVIDNVWTMRLDQLRNAANPLAQDFGFREAVASQDEATMRSALQNVAARLHASHAFIVRYDGRVIGLTPDQDTARADDLWSLLDDGWQSGALRYKGATYLGVASEIDAPELIGWLVIARRLDAAELRAISSMSSVPLQATVVRRGEGSGWVNDADGASLHSAKIAKLLDRLTPVVGGNNGQVMESIGGDVVYARALGSRGGRVELALALEYSMADALAQYGQLKLALALTGILALLLALFASSRLAAGIARPLSELESAAAKLQLGERIDVSTTSADEIGRLTSAFNAMSAEIVERELRISHMAFHDALTDLPNRVLLQEQLEHALKLAAKRKGRLAVLCLDLDNFKIINDTLGHPIGDALLRIVAQRLRDAVEPHVVARLGGDEFAVLLTDESGALLPEKVARRIIEIVTEPMIIEGNQVVVGTSIGIALAPSDASEADDLLKHADLALYKAKEGGRGTLRFFEAEMDAQAQQRRALELDMRSGLLNGEFELYFQPLFDLSTNTFCAFEALIRWNHPERGMISPVDFIPVAEETGLIVPIGEWVIQEACRHASQWPENIRVAVNVSTIQFRSPGLSTVVLRAVSAAGLNPNRLEIEITESVFLNKSSAILEVLHGLRALGVRIALDDFGTGYSSLSYLRSFPFDKIKIDRSFIIGLLDDQEASAVIHAITDLARALGMETTAEGVEELAQLDILRVHGCTNVQGYLFSRPVAAGDVRGLLDAGGQGRAVA